MSNRSVRIVPYPYLYPLPELTAAGDCPDCDGMLWMTDVDGSLTGDRGRWTPCFCVVLAEPAWDAVR